ncbi:MAG: hypothetical protein LN560_04875 [Rickettsia endosymbiont of Sceptobius lativentris]|nr:hypothetical protein [Rickettsia endosymbiont of Sceptobius lativentris]
MKFLKFFQKLFFPKRNNCDDKLHTDYYNNLFQDNNFENYEYHEIPLNRDCYLMDEKHMFQYEQNLLNFFQNYSHDKDYEPIGYVACVGVREINKNSIKLSWFPNVIDRFHEVAVNLPKKEFIKCVGSWNYDEKPHIFVRGDWLEHLHVKYYSIFGMIDAVDMKNALQRGDISLEKLVKLRKAIDNIARDYKNISFISFADTILLKSNWSLEYQNKNFKYTPEIFFSLAQKIRREYKVHLNLDSYAIFTQGSNEYYESSLLQYIKN